MRASGANAGLSLIEAIASIVILAFAITISYGAIGSAMPRAIELEHPVSAVQLARDLVDEVLSKPFDDPDGVDGEGLTSGGARTAWDDMDDYGGFADAPPHDPEGVAIPGGSAYARRVVVTPQTGSLGVNPFLGSTRAAATFLRVDVYVSRGGADIVRLSAVKANPANVIPAPRSGLVYVDGTRTDTAGNGNGNGSAESASFDVKNRTSGAIQVSAVRVSWTPADVAYFRTFRITHGTSVGTFSAGGSYVAAGQLVTLDQAVTIPPNGTARVEVEHFRDDIGGQGPAHHVGDLTFTLLWTSGSRTYQTDIRVGG